MPIFRSQHQAELLATLFMHPAMEYSLTELAEHVGVALPTLHREAVRLESAGLISSRTVGRNRMLRASLDHPAAEHLARLLEATYGPRAVIEDEFNLPGVDQVLIFGSWAARYLGKPGPAPNDVDVLVIGEVKRTDLYEAADRAQARLGLPVNPVMRSQEAWHDPSDKLSSQIKVAPFLDVTSSNVQKDHDDSMA